MKYLVEYKKFNYEPNDIVLIHYWYSDMITPVKILEKSGNKYLVSHNISESKIHNAPDEYIKGSEIIDKYRIK